MQLPRMTKRRWMIAMASLGIAHILSAPPALHAQSEDGWVGKRVVQRYPGFRLRLEDQVIDPQGIRTYRVEQVNGSWLRLKAEGEGRSGWALADHVVPVEEAFGFFTDSIRANPGDSFGYKMRAFISQHERTKLDIASGASTRRSAAPRSWRPCTSTTAMPGT